jgi:NadR type nicotinamide-nucleotide adenylyltransferase
MTTGLVIGKFYPPHSGHKFLFESAQAKCDQLIILVCASKKYDISSTDRAEWIKELIPHADIRIIPELPSDDDSVGWAHHVKYFLGLVPDMVFSSEDYGEPFAKALGSKHVLVDKDRLTVPMSGTQVRANPFASWDYIDDAVRGHYAKRIVVLGAESTGTTTLAKDLANALKTVFVPEYGRLFYESRQSSGREDQWVRKDLVHIARMQQEMITYLSRTSNKYTIVDTDAFVTRLWSERLLGAVDTEVHTIAASSPGDIYILTGDEIPFVEDGTRHALQDRHEFQQRFVEDLAWWPRPYILVTGSKEERLQKALDFIKEQGL